MDIGTLFTYAGSAAGLLSAYVLVVDRWWKDRPRIDVMLSRDKSVIPRPIYVRVTNPAESDLVIEWVATAQTKIGFAIDDTVLGTVAGVVDGSAQNVVVPGRSSVRFRVVYRSSLDLSAFRVVIKWTLGGGRPFFRRGRTGHNVSRDLLDRMRAAQFGEAVA